MNKLLAPLVAMLFGPDVKTTLVGFLGAVTTLGVAYFGTGHVGMGWAGLAAAFAAFGRYVNTKLPPSSGGDGTKPAA